MIALSCPRVVESQFELVIRSSLVDLMGWLAVDGDGGGDQSIENTHSVRSSMNVGCSILDDHHRAELIDPPRMLSL